MFKLTNLIGFGGGVPAEQDFTQAWLNWDSSKDGANLTLSSTHLGKFYSADMTVLNTTAGAQEAVFVYVKTLNKVSTFGIRQVNINTATKTFSLGTELLVNSDIDGNIASANHIGSVKLVKITDTKFVFLYSVRFDSGGSELYKCFGNVITRLSSTTLSDGGSADLILSNSNHLPLLTGEKVPDVDKILLCAYQGITAGNDRVEAKVATVNVTTLTIGASQDNYEPTTDRTIPFLAYTGDKFALGVASENQDQFSSAYCEVAGDVPTFPGTIADDDVSINSDINDENRAPVVWLERENNRFMQVASGMDSVQGQRRFVVYSLSGTTRSSFLGTTETFPANEFEGGYSLMNVGGTKVGDTESVVFMLAAVANGASSNTVGRILSEDGTLNTSAAVQNITSGAANAQMEDAPAAVELIAGNKAFAMFLNDDGATLNGRIIVA